MTPHRSFNASSSYRIAGNFRWCKFLRKSVQTLQKKFLRLLFSRMRDSLATPLSVDGHAPYAKRHWTTKRRSKPVQQQPDLPFVWRLSKLRRYQDCRRGRETGVLDSAADLDFDNCGTSHGFVGILYSSRLIVLYSNHLEGRQTVENHLVQGTNSYQRAHVMTSSIPS